MAATYPDTINWTRVRYYHLPDGWNDEHAHKAIGDVEADAAESAGLNYITRADLERMIGRSKVEQLTRFGDINPWGMRPCRCTFGIEGETE